MASWDFCIRIKKVYFTYKHRKICTEQMLILDHILFCKTFTMVTLRQLHPNSSTKIRIDNCFRWDIYLCERDIYDILRLRRRKNYFIILTLLLIQTIFVSFSFLRRTKLISSARTKWPLFSGPGNRKSCHVINTFLSGEM